MSDIPDRPYIRRVGSDRGLPADWVTLPVGSNGDPATEVCFDPDRHDVLVATGRRGGTFPALDSEASSADVMLDALGMSGWRALAASSPYVWYRDRAAAERQQAAYRDAHTRPVVGFEDTTVRPTRPFIRLEGSDKPIPPGWIAEPTTAWNGQDAKVVYDPRRHDVLRVGKTLSSKAPRRSQRKHAVDVIDQPVH